MDVSILGVRAVEPGLVAATGEYNSDVLRSIAQLSCFSFFQGFCRRLCCGLQLGDRSL